MNSKAGSIRVQAQISRRPSSSVTPMDLRSPSGKVLPF
jgi:hypothetical protein